MLPNTVKKPLLPIFTPTSWQTVLLRLYGLVDNDLLAQTTKACIEEEACRLGIDKILYDCKWRERGYITILKAVWNLLPYSQILFLLGISSEELEYRLKEDDFLSVKLGEKPECEAVYYAPLTPQELAETERIATLIRENFIDGYTAYFDFYHIEGKKMDNGGVDRISYDYSAQYGDIQDDVTDEELVLLAEKGINGLWFQGVLSKLSPYPFKPSLCEGYEKRREKLNALIERCGKYGIKVYLYINEPRGMAESDFLPEHRECMGGREENLRAMCTSHPLVKQYLFDAAYSLVCACPKLGGFITITMSENLTNCYSRGDKNCPRCQAREREEVVAEVNNILYAALEKAGTGTRLIANLWAWTKGHGWTDAQIDRGISLLSDGIEVMCVSELGTIERDGKSKYIAEYSLSNIGPSVESAAMLAQSKKCGHKTWAKVQVNNSWECATVPYIPVFELIIEHFNNLRPYELNGYMLSWTVGGYPSKTMELIKALTNGEFDYASWLKENYGEYADHVKNAIHSFSQAFKKIPYDWTLLYNGAQHLGAANLFYANPTGYTATMVGFPYDDLPSWRGNFTEKQFQDGLEAMLAQWEDGLNELEDCKEEVLVQELYRMAKLVYVQFRSLLNQTRYILARDVQDKASMMNCLQEEIKWTTAQYALASKDARLGFEASNHYYYTQNSFLEKLINLNVIMGGINHES